MGALGMVGSSAGAEGDDGSIGNRVWADTNRNGNQDPGEVGIGGVEVMLLDIATGEELARKRTSPAGWFSFRGLDESKCYRMRVRPGTGRRFTRLDATSNDLWDSDVNPSNDLIADRICFEGRSDQFWWDVGLVDADGAANPEAEPAAQPAPRGGEAAAGEPDLVTDLDRGVATCSQRSGIDAGELRRVISGRAGNEPTFLLEPTGSNADEAIWQSQSAEVICTRDVPAGVGANSIISNSDAVVIGSNSSDRLDGPGEFTGWFGGAGGDDRLGVVGGAASVSGGPGADRIERLGGSATFNGGAGTDTVGIMNGATSRFNGDSGVDRVELLEQGEFWGGTEHDRVAEQTGGRFIP